MQLAVNGNSFLPYVQRVTMINRSEAEERHFVPESLSKISSRCTAGPIKTITKKST